MMGFLEINIRGLDRAFHEMKDRVSPGEDQITSEIIEIGGEPLMELRLFLNECLTKEKIPTMR